MGKLEELMQEVMKVISRQGFLPDSVELKVKVGENWYSVKWKKPVVYPVQELDIGLALEDKKKRSKARKKGK